MPRTSYELPTKRESATATLARNPHQDADRQPARQHERAPVTKEWERNSGDRHEVEGHANVDQHVHEPARHQPERDETAERVIRALGDLGNAQEEPEEQR